MKTAISIPDEVFEQAEKTARRLGVSRSELYAKAVREFIERHRQAHITDQLDELYADDPSMSALDPVLGVLQTQSVDGRDGEDW